MWFRLGKAIPTCAMMALALLPSTALSAFRYEITDLRSFGMVGGAINNLGVIAGASDQGHLLVYDGLEVLDLGTGDGVAAWPTAINDAGQIVGFIEDASGRKHAFMFSDGAFTRLSVPLDSSESHARDINNLGDVVGVWRADDGIARGFLYSGGVVSDLGSLGGELTSPFPFAVNTSGQVVGWATTAGPRIHTVPFLYSDGEITNLNAGNNRRAWDNNDAGAIVGGTDSGLIGNTGAFAWSAGRTVGLGELSPLSASSEPESHAFSINNLGVVVGWAGRPFVRHGGPIRDLNALVDFADSDLTSVGSAYAINDRGEILTGYLLLSPIKSSGGPPELANLSIRASAGTGDQTTILGVTLSSDAGSAGSSNAELMLRAVGPSLSDFNVTDVVDDPRLDLFSGATHRDQNDDWSAASNAGDIVTAAARVGAFPLADDSADAVLLTQLSGGSYTFHATAESESNGVLLAEVYDAAMKEAGGAQDAVFPRIVNGSARLQVGTGEKIGILGFVLSGDTPTNVLIRAIGPTLEAFDVRSVLRDPVLWLHAGSNAVMGNDDWGTKASVPLLSEMTERVHAFSLPDGSKDAAFLIQLEPGIYTAHVSGADGGSGVALIEVYLAPDIGG